MTVCKPPTPEERPIFVDVGHAMKSQPVIAIPNRADTLFIDIKGWYSVAEVEQILALIGHGKIELLKRQGQCKKTDIQEQNGLKRSSELTSELL